MERIFLSNNTERKAIKMPTKQSESRRRGFLPVEQRRLFSDLKRPDKTNQAKGKTKYEHYCE
jgi:hypothetical protein